MGNRLSKIYTRTGDDGTTGMADGSRLDKTHPRIETIGAVDEVNSAVGMVLAEDETGPPLREMLERIQHELFDLGAGLAAPKYAAISAEHISRLESDLDLLNEDLPPLKEFVLPGGNRAAASCHLARSICRRAERRAWQLAVADEIDRPLIRYLNRLSDLLFVAARVLARRRGGHEVLWRHERP
jgi:cob(I)alamin adenosyltransferase